MSTEYITKKEQDVLEYKPSFKKKEFVTEVDKSEVTSLYKPSLMLKQLREYAPSKVSGLLGDAVQSATTLLKRLDKELAGVTGNGVSFEQYKKALVESDYDTIDKFEDYHTNSLYGDVRAELYGTLYKMTDDLVSFKEFFDTQNYGDKVDQKDKIDELLLAKMESHEKEGTGQVNYTAAYLDVQLNMYATDRATTTIDAVAHMTDVMYNSEKHTVDASLSKNPGMNKITESAFNSEAKLAFNDKAKLETIDNSSIRQQNVSASYDKRYEVLEIMSTIEHVDKISSPAVLEQVKTNIEDTYRAVSTSIADLHRVSKLDTMYRTDYIQTVERKNNLRNFYSASNN